MSKDPIYRLTSPMCPVREDPLDPSKITGHKGVLTATVHLPDVLPVGSPIIVQGQVHDEDGELYNLHCST